MLRPKRKTPDDVPFRMPTLAEADPAYGELLERRTTLNQAYARLQAEVRELEAQLAKEPAPAFRPEVAELRGESAGSASVLRAQIREKQAQVAHHQAAIQVLEQRLTEARAGASVKVCDAAKPEYARRVRAICEALVVLDNATADLVAMRHDFEREDVAWLRLIPMTPRFLGDIKDPERPIMRHLKEAKEAGYWNVH